jgi:hypothetical protein
MEKVEIRAVIKYLCKKGMSPRKSMKTTRWAKCIDVD